MLPYLLGEKTPVNDPLARGAIVGLSAAHGRGHVFRAVLESFAYGVRHHLEVLAEHGVRPHARARHERRRLVALWKQIVADVTGLVLEPVVDHPGSALGAAYAAGMGTGAFAEWSDIGRFVALGEPILPRAETPRSTTCATAPTARSTGPSAAA